MWKILFVLTKKRKPKQRNGGILYLYSEMLRAVKSLSDTSMKNMPIAALPARGFTDFLKILACLACFWVTSGLHGQELDLAFLDKLPKSTDGSVPVFYYEKGAVVRQSVLANAPSLAPMALVMPPCSPCPTIAAILINGCYNPASIDPDEFLIINSGGGFTMSDLQIDFQSNGGSAQNNDINFIFTAGFGTNVTTVPCGLAAGDLSKVTGCANFISATASTVVPPNTIRPFASLAMSEGPSIDSGSASKVATPFVPKDRSALPSP